MPRSAPPASPPYAGRRRRALGVAFVLAVTTAAPAQDTLDAAQRTAQEQAARQRLDAVRAELKALATQQRATTDQRGEAVRALREQELALAAIARDVHALDDRLAAQQAEFDRLERRRGELEAALKTQRAALAVLLRSAYALGHDEELKLLLQQEDVAAIARVLAYHRYFQRAQVGQIERLRGDLQELATLEAAITAARGELAATRAARGSEGARLEAERTERARRLAAIDGQLRDQAARLAALGRDESELTGLIERLRDVFADIPKQLTGAQPFASLRGQLAWPLQGKVVTAFGAADDGGRRSSGLLLAARPGTTVHAVSHGRVAFADWLRGYGLMLIVDHGDGYLSLYGCNETLLKDVGDWVNAGETIATSGASGGQKSAGLYFELRAKGRPVDPRGWLR